MHFFFFSVLAAMTAKTIFDTKQQAQEEKKIQDEIQRSKQEQRDKRQQEALLKRQALEEQKRKQIRNFTATTDKKPRVK